MSAFHQQRFPILNQANRLNWTSDSQGDCECPAHQDQKNSLHVTVEGNKLLLRCLAGCDVPSIIQGWGENRYSVLFAQSDTDGDKNNGGGKSRIIATYDYVDASGKLIHQTVRFLPKDFRQRRPASEGSTAGRSKAKRDKDGKWWLWTLKGIDPVLYRLPELRQRSAEPVYLVEGEKDADNLAKAFKVLATTNPMGAAKWRKSYSQQLKGRTVYLIPDVDKPRDDGSNPGLTHVQTVARALTGIASDVRILDLPPLGLTPKWDVSDWIDKGGTLELLNEAVGKAKPFDPDEHQTDDQPKLTNAVMELDAVRALPITEIARHIKAATGGWPKSVDDRLFVVDRQPTDTQRASVGWLDSASSLFAWLAVTTGQNFEFRRGGQCAPREDIYQAMPRLVEQYQAVETVPHHPPIAGHYYACPPIEPGDGSTLSSFLDFFRPETQIDRDLITAMLLTPLIGCRGGERPCFLVTGAGRGSGKSVLSELVGSLYGGSISMQSHEGLADLMPRLLSPSAATLRVVRLDNIKSHRLSSADLESLITASTISGKRLYSGEGRRPNTLTYILTLNGPSLSRDMAQRTVPIHLAESESAYSASWRSDVETYLDTHWQAIIGDLTAILSEPPQELERYSRWGTWERDVLSKLPEPSECQAVIRERQAVIDDDSELAAEITTIVRDNLESLHYSTDVDRVFVPSRVLTQWYQHATGDRGSAASAAKTIKQAIEEQLTTNLTVSPSRKSGRGYYWTGSAAEQGEIVRHDIEDRISDQKKRMQEKHNPYWT